MSFNLSFTQNKNILLDLSISFDTALQHVLTKQARAQCVTGEITIA